MSVQVSLQEFIVILSFLKRERKRDFANVSNRQERLETFEPVRSGRLSRCGHETFMYTLQKRKNYCKVLCLQLNALESCFGRDRLLTIYKQNSSSSQLDFLLIPYSRHLISGRLLRFEKAIKTTERPWKAKSPRTFVNVRPENL